MEAPDIHHYPARLASSTFQIRVPLHGEIRQEKALCCDGRLEPDRTRLGMACQPSHACGLSGENLSFPHVNQVMPAGYLERTYRFRRQREAGAELDFFRLVDSTWVVSPDTVGSLALVLAVGSYCYG